MESWVDIKKNNQIMRVPYQAFKDRFEHDGFSLVDENLNADPTFSVSKPENEVVDKEIPQQQEQVVIEPQKVENEIIKETSSQKKGGQKNGNKSKRKH